MASENFRVLLKVIDNRLTTMSQRLRAARVCNDTQRVNALLRMIDRELDQRFAVHPVHRES